MASSSKNPATKWLDLNDSQISIQTIHELLDAVHDDLWVSAACLDRLVDDTVILQALLQTGIARTERPISRAQSALHDNKDTSSSDALAFYFQEHGVDAQACRLRALLLQRLDRLETYIEMSSDEITTEDSDNTDTEELDEWEDDPWGDSAETAKPSLKPHSLPVTLSDFLLEDIVHSACLLAFHCRFDALRILLRRHSPALWPYRFYFLDSIPQYAYPAEYCHLLPSIDQSTSVETVPQPQPWRTASDWSESPSVTTVLKQLESSDSPSSSQLPVLAVPAPLSAGQLSKWYKSRMEHIMASTGMVDIALYTIQHGASHGVPSLDEIGESLSLFSRLVYDAPQGDVWDTSGDWTWSQWRSLQPSEVVRALVAHSTPEAIANDISHLVMPYLYVQESRSERAGSPDPSIHTRLLYDFILSSPLETAAALFEASKPIHPVHERPIKSEGDIVRLALACLYGSPGCNDWPTMSRIFECMPAWEFERDQENDEEATETTIASLGAYVTPTTSQPECTPPELLQFFQPLPLSSLSRALDILDVHLEGGEILARWNVPVPLRWFLQSNGDEQEQRAWAKKMARRSGAVNDKLLTEEDWDWLLSDMLKLAGKSETGVRGAFALLTKDEVQRIFFGGLLSTGEFGIAREMLHHSSNLSLSGGDIENLCIEASREYYDNASSGNYKVGEMKLAYDCLKVAPKSERIAREQDFIEATSRISSFNVMLRPGIPISPIEIRLTKDRLSLVARVLSTNTDAYKHPEVILDLVRKLGFASDVVAEVKTLAMLADAALQDGSYALAYENSERMTDMVANLRASTNVDPVLVHDASEVCWLACLQLGRHAEFDDIGLKMALVSRALELCPAEKLQDVLNVWFKLETEDIELREQRLAQRRVGVKRKRVDPETAVSSLKARLQDFHMPAPPLLSTPDAAALASRTFKSVAASFPFSVGSRGRSNSSRNTDNSQSRSRTRTGGDADVSTQASKAFARGISWLIGADEVA
ncbi:Sec39-domain-containing protein [Fistulina hepatica ATCC 64428]|uniref:Sec39-domain-containing protein n=1 Tax=Fistulina hepatica ATCC 64428 TaxID=1128425 RepID=A0A0D7AH19_9AGAR|nr:Sec39-domain-containing protein [Fistulina hepatica ATCC 64428]